MFPLAFENGDTFFQIENDGQQNCFHRIVIALVSGGLGVGADAFKQAVKMRLIVAAQSAPKLRPVRYGVLDQLNKCRNGSAHHAPV